MWVARKWIATLRNSWKNLRIRERFWEKPTLETLESSLRAMADHMVRNGVKRAAMPLIGCGLDGLRWRDVRALLDKVFRGAGRDYCITVFRL